VLNRTPHVGGPTPDYRLPSWGSARCWAIPPSASPPSHAAQGPTPPKPVAPGDPRRHLSRRLDLFAANHHTRRGKVGRVAAVCSGIALELEGHHRERWRGIRRRHCVFAKHVGAGAEVEAGRSDQNRSGAWSDRSTVRPGSLVENKAAMRNSIVLPATTRVYRPEYIPFHEQLAGCMRPLCGLHEAAGCVQPRDKCVVMGCVDVKGEQEEKEGEEQKRSSTTAATCCSSSNLHAAAPQWATQERPDALPSTKNLMPRRNDHTGILHMVHLRQARTHLLTR
jgi:hypothetical protein